MRQMTVSDLLSAWSFGGRAGPRHSCFLVLSSPRLVLDQRGQLKQRTPPLATSPLRLGSRLCGRAGPMSRGRALPSKSPCAGGSGGGATALRATSSKSPTSLCHQAMCSSAQVTFESAKVWSRPDPVSRTAPALAKRSATPFPRVTWRSGPWSSRTALAALCALQCLTLTAGDDLRVSASFPFRLSRKPHKANQISA